MKYFNSLIIVLSTITYSAFGQTTDKIIKIKGDTLKVTVTNVSESTITYSYPNETVTTTINRKVVKQIIYKSGRTEDISSPVIINGEADFEKVILTKDPNEVIGLVKKGEVQSKAQKGFGKESKLRITATEDLKKEVAKKGGFIVLVQSDNFSNSPLNNVTLSGIAYGY